MPKGKSQPEQGLILDSGGATTLKGLQLVKKPMQEHLSKKQGAVKRTASTTDWCQSPVLPVALLKGPSLWHVGREGKSGVWKKAAVFFKCLIYLFL